MAYIAKVTAGGNSNMLVGNSLYGNCTTAAGTAVKAVTISGFDTLVAGVTIHVRFANANTAKSPTLNVSSTGEKPIYKYGTIVPGITAATSWQAGSVIALTYNTNANSSGCWVMNDHLDDNNTTYSAGTGIALASGAFSLGTSGVTAGSYGPSANIAPAEGGTFSVPYVTVDTYGRVTAASSKTITVPNILKTGYSHNSIYRGDSLGTSVSSAQWTSIRKGTFDDMYIGDYWTINSHKYVIAKFYYCSPASTSSYPSVLMLDFSQSVQKMNDTNTTLGGYAGSKMRTFMDETVTPQLDTDFTSSHVYKPYWSVDNGVVNGIVTGRTSIQAKACLLSEVDVWGYRRMSAYAHQYGSYSASYDYYDGVGHPIPLISLTGSYTPHGGIGWLRDVSSADTFARVDTLSSAYGGNATHANADYASVVRPAFFIY